jgi:DNA-nicking Smr family endonuclease
VDLHGLGTEAAKEALERFLVESRRRGHRCVLVVHGRGLHSKDQVPVIKERMGAWLSRGRLSKIVLAFATARPTDGGAGASYVLLRR